MVQDLVDLIEEYSGWSLGALTILILGLGIYRGIRDARLRSRKTKEMVRYIHAAIDQIPEEYRNDIAMVIRGRIALETSNVLIDSWTESLGRIPKKYSKIVDALTGKLVPWLYRYKPDSIEGILQEYNL